MSILFIFMVGAIILGVPFYLTYERFFGVPRFVLILALMGVYVVLMYIKPGIFPLWTLWIAVMMLVAAVRFFLKGHRESLFDPLKHWPALAILIYGFSLFLFRWEPPGDQSVVLGSLARLISETGVIPGETGPIALGAHLKGTHLGTAIMVALLQWGKWVSIERVLLFVSCLSGILFCFSLGNVLSTWFDRKISFIAAFVGFVLFSVPQKFVVTGASPALLAFTAGFCLIEFVKLCHIRSPSFWEIGVFAFAIAFGAYADLSAFFVSQLVCFPIAILLMTKSSKSKKFIKPTLLLGALSLGVFSPYLWQWGFEFYSQDLYLAWDSRKIMSPYLFQQDHSLLFNLCKQLIFDVSPLSAMLCIFIFFLSLFVEKKHKYFVPALLASVVIVVLVFNVRHWFLPFSALLPSYYAGAFLVFPLTMSLAWFLGQSWEDHGKIAPWLVYGLLALFSLREFSDQLYPYFFNSELSQRDREAMSYIEKYVPASDCIEVGPDSAGRWIPAVAFRCTVPFQGFPTHIISNKGGKVSGKAKWRYYALKEKRSLAGLGESVFDNGALVQRFDTKPGRKNLK